MWVVVLTRSHQWWGRDRAPLSDRLQGVRQSGASLQWQEVQGGSLGWAPTWQSSEDGKSWQSGALGMKNLEFQEENSALGHQAGAPTWRLRKEQSCLQSGGRAQQDLRQSWSDTDLLTLTVCTASTPRGTGCQVPGRSFLQKDSVVSAE